MRLLVNFSKKNFTDFGLAHIFSVKLPLSPENMNTKSLDNPVKSKDFAVFGGQNAVFGGQNTALFLDIAVLGELS
jgi:hypothetical protein